MVIALLIEADPFDVGRMRSDVAATARSEAANDNADSEPAAREAVVEPRCDGVVGHGELMSAMDQKRGCRQRRALAGR